MAGAFGHSSSYANATAGTSHSWSHDSTGDTYLVVSINHRYDPGTTTVTYNGVSMTLLQEQSASYNWQKLYGLANPATGSNTIAVTTTNSVKECGAAISCSGANHVRAIVTASVAAGAGGMTATGTLTAGDIFVGFGGVPDYAATIALTTGSNEVEGAVALADCTVNGGTNTGTGSVDLAWSYSSGGDPKTYIAVILDYSIIAFDATANSTETSSSSKTWSHTCTGSDLVLVCAGYIRGTQTCSGVTYGGVSMTQVETPQAPSSYNDKFYVFYLINPATGANNCVASFSGTDYNCWASASYTGAKQTGQPDASIVHTPTTTITLSTDITTVADNSWIITAAASQNGRPGNGTLTNKRSSFSFGGLFDSNGPITPAATTTITTVNDFSINESTAHIVMSLAPAASAGGTFTPTPTLAFLGCG